MDDAQFNQEVVKAFTLISNSLISFDNLEFKIVKADDRALDMEDIFVGSELTSSTPKSGPGSGIIDTSNDVDTASNVDRLTAQLANALTVVHYNTKVYEADTPKQLNEAALKRINTIIHTAYQEFPKLRGAYKDASRRQYIYKDRPKLSMSAINMHSMYIKLATEANQWIVVYNKDHPQAPIRDDEGNRTLPTH